jgi:hypothetical protein
MKTCGGVDVLIHVFLTLTIVFGVRLEVRLWPMWARRMVFSGNWHNPDLT